MDCRTADKMIIRYIQRELDDDETAAFLKHIRTCQSCRNELEINYDIIDCLKALDSPGEDIQIGTGMEQEIRASYQHLRTVRFFRIIHYAVNTLVVLSLILTAMLQFRILYIH